MNYIIMIDGQDHKYSRFHLRMLAGENNSTPFFRDVSIPRTPTKTCKAATCHSWKKKKSSNSHPSDCKKIKSQPFVLDRGYSCSTSFTLFFFFFVFPIFMSSLSLIWSNNFKLNREISHFDQRSGLYIT